MGYIYIVINDVNDKVYIGQTSTSLKQRWNEHTGSDINDNTHFHNAIKKYGKDKFHMYLIEECNIEDLNSREIFYIEYFNSYNNGYNMTPGGAGVPGYRHTAEDRQIMSKASKSFWENLSTLEREQFIQYRASKLKDVPKTDEHKSNLSKARMGKYTGEDNGFYGKHHTNETKELMRKAATGRKSLRRKQVKLIDLGILFDSYTEAWKWLISRNICRTKKPQSTTTQIKESIKRNTKAYGYHWEEV